MPTPTLDQLAHRHFAGDLRALVGLLDALDTTTLRQARIERHARARPALASLPSLPPQAEASQ